jgi:aminotransferase
MISLSRNASQIVQSEIRIMSVECAKVGGVNLAQGICDTEVPLPVRRAAHAAIDGGVNSYTRLIGLDDLRQAIARKLREYNRISADAETEIVVTVGSTGAFYSACLALLDPGDEVIVFEPFYSYHVNTLEAISVVPAYVTLKPPDCDFTRDA